MVCFLNFSTQIRVVRLIVIQYLEIYLNYLGASLYVILFVFGISILFYYHTVWHLPNYYLTSQIHLGGKISLIPNGFDSVKEYTNAAKL